MSTVNDSVQVFLHEMLHGLDHQLTGYSLDRKFLPRVDKSRVRTDGDNQQGWVYAAPADRQTPMSNYMFMYFPRSSYHFQAENVPWPEQQRLRFKEFVTIVGQLLYDNAYRAILLDRKSVVQWLQTFDEVFWSSHTYSNPSPPSGSPSEPGNAPRRPRSRRRTS